MSKIYRIVAREWIAATDPRFNEKSRRELVSGLTLKEAQERLLAFYNEDCSREASSWGAAVRQRGNYGVYAYPTHKDGTRSYEYDSRTFSIVEDRNFHPHRSTHI